VSSRAPILLAVRPCDASHGWRSLGPSVGPPSPAGLAYAAALALLLWLVFDRALYVTARASSPAIPTTSATCPSPRGHLGFALGTNFPPEHPELAGARLTYPFLVDFGAALLVRAGASERAAYLLQNLLLAAAFVALLHLFTLRLTGDRRRPGSLHYSCCSAGGSGSPSFSEMRSPRGGLASLLAHLPGLHDRIREAALG